jgi:uncharacterized protein (TIGR02145 family)
MKNRIGYLWLALMFVTFTTSIISCKSDSQTIIEPSFTVTDIDGNVYNTIAIGNQVWLTTNLRTTRYRNGDSIPNVSASAAWSSSLTGAHCNYDNLDQTGKTFGYLYNLFALTDSRGLAPAGYHVPTQAEIETLTKFLGPTAAGKMKETGLVNWASPNTGATNSTFLSFLPGGLRNANGTYALKDSVAAIWTRTTEPGGGSEPEMHATYNLLHYNSDSLTTNTYGRGYLGFSVRCLRD